MGSDNAKVLVISKIIATIDFMLVSLII